MTASWVDGGFDKQISPHDQGFLSGLGVFETIGVFDGALPLWPAHLRRLERGADALGIPFEPRADLLSVAKELLARATGDDILRVTLAAGVAENPTWCLTTRRRTAPHGPAQAQAPVPVRLHVPASTPPSPIAAIKTTSRAFYAAMLREAHAAGAADALLLGPGGRVRETTTANVFFYRGEELRTPRLDGTLLPGIARAALIENLAALGARVQESDWERADVENADGLFVTNAVYGPRSAALPSGVAAPLRPVVLEAWRNATARSDG